MILRTWLRHNSLFRRLRLLSDWARQLLSENLFLPVLFPKHPFIVDRGETEHDETGALTDALIEQEGRALRILSTDAMRFDAPYQDLLKPARDRTEESYKSWIAPLERLPHGAGAEEFEAAVRPLKDFSEQGQNHFPLKAYLQAFPNHADSTVKLLHRCIASRQTALDLLLGLAGQTKEPKHNVEPSLLLIYQSPKSDSNRMDRINRMKR